jgi:hypothetical protein
MNRTEAVGSPNYYYRCIAAEKIAKYLKPGDVINTGWKMNWWDIFRPKKWLRNIACWRIQEYQKAYFGNRSVWDSTHTRINLSQIGNDIHSNDIFEVTDPISRFVSLYSIALEDIRILRYTFDSFSNRDIRTMYAGAKQIEGTKYDRQQLLDFLLHQILGYPKEPFTLFDEGPDQKVCSTGVATLFNYLRKHQVGKLSRTVDFYGNPDLAADPEDMISNAMLRLFDIVNVDLWKKNGVFDNIDQCLDPDAVPGIDRIRTPIERVTPAHFDNPEYFQNEFTEVARFKNGEQYYHWPVKSDSEATSTSRE